LRYSVLDISLLAESLLLSVVWTAGLGSTLKYLEIAIARLETQLQKELAGAKKLPVAELVRSGHLSSALRVSAHTSFGIFLPCVSITNL